MPITYTETDNALGIKTRFHEEDGRVAIEKEYDAEPLLKLAAAERAKSDGERWGEMRKVGHIPMAELAKLMRQDGSIDAKRCAEWLKQNPAMVSFNRFLL